MLNMKYLEELEEYMKSGNMEEDFKWSGEERRQEMLEFLEYNFNLLCTNREIISDVWREYVNRLPELRAGLLRRD